jgi:hypothetical protein
MKIASIRLFSVVFLAAAVASAGACASTTTVTVPLVVPGTTVTLPAITTTLPDVTITLPGGVTTIPATTVTIPATVTSVPTVTLTPPPTVPGGFLPTTPTIITNHAGIMDSLSGDCLTCHGPTLYLQFPMAPTWDGSAFPWLYPGLYFVVPGSIQDHTGRTADQCVTCHSIAS